MRLRIFGFFSHTRDARAKQKRMKRQAEDYLRDPAVELPDDVWKLILSEVRQDCRLRLLQVSKAFHYMVLSTMKTLYLVKGLVKWPDSLFRKCSSLQNLTLIFTDGGSYPKINDASLSSLVNLKTLRIAGNRVLKNAALSSLKSLTWLDLRDCWHITDSALLGMTNLKHLDLERNESITDSALFGLTKLERLILNSNKNITDLSLMGLTGLKKLALNNNHKVTKRSVSKLAGLTTLLINHNKNITPDAIKGLTNLTELSHRYNYSFLNRGQV